MKVFKAINLTVFSKKGILIESKKTIRVLAFARKNEDKRAIEAAAKKNGFALEFVNSVIKCLVKLQSRSYDALIVDSLNLMKSKSVNISLLAMLTKSAPVIIYKGEGNNEVENTIRAEKIFYFLTKPICEAELVAAVQEAAKWNETEAARVQESGNLGLKYGNNILKTLGVCALFIMLMGGVSGAGEIAVSVSPLRNLSGNTAYDWIGAGFAHNLLTSLKNISGIRVVEEIEMEKLMEGIKLSLTGYMEQEDSIQKGRVIGAHYSVVGSVQIFEDNVIVCYRLVNMETREVCFSNSMKGKLRRILDMEEKVNKDIVIHFLKRFAGTTLKSGAGLQYKPGKNLVHGNGAQYLEYSTMSDLDEAARSFEAAINENADFGDGYLGLGDIYMLKEDYFEAMVKFSKALNLYKKYDDKHFTGWAYYKIGETYYMQGYYDNAVTNFRRALDCKKNSKNDFQVLYIYQRMASIAAERSNPGEAARYFKLVEMISKKLGDTNSRIEALAELAKLHEAKGEIIPAAKYSSKALKLSGKTEYLRAQEVNELDSRLQAKLSGSNGQDETFTTASTKDYMYR